MDEQTRNNFEDAMQSKMSPKAPENVKLSPLVGSLLADPSIAGKVA